jgi:hypothetical protein
MNFGEKIELLFVRSGCKDYQVWGKAMGFKDGNWLLDMKKKDTVNLVDITRLIVVADYHNITLDQLLKDNEDNWIVDVNSNLQDNDICIMFDNIVKELEVDTPKFNGYTLSDDNTKMVKTTIEIIKGLIKSRL